MAEVPSSTSSSKSASKGTSTKTSATPVVITSFPLNPLTATYKPPDDCSGLYKLTNGLYVIDASTTCMPTSFQAGISSYFSPGIVCPSGYSTACHGAADIASITTVTCCPTRGDIQLTCVSDPWNLRQAWSDFFCTWVATKSTTITVTESSNGVTSTVTEQLIPGDGLNAFGARMVYESSDTSSTGKTTSKPATNTAQTTTSSTGSRTSSISSSTSKPQGSASSGMSTGAKVAIGIVVPLVVLAVLGVLFFVWRRRKARYNAVATSQSPIQDNKPPVFGSDPVYELGNNGPQPELMGDTPGPKRGHQAELPADR